MKRTLLLLCAIGMSNAIAVEEPHTSDVLDLGAWVGTWMVALGAYAGRQERPYRRQDDSPKDDLPDVYIPNELSANEIEKAFSLAGKKQAVIEANEMLNYLEWISRKTLCVELKDGYFHTHPTQFPTIKDFLLNEAELDQGMVDTVMELAESIKMKSKFDDWNDMSAELDRIYQEIVSKGTEKNYIKQTDDGHYTLTKTITDTVKKVVNDTILSHERRWRLRDENDFEAFKDYEKFEENVNNMIGSGAAIVHLPRDLTWDGIKSSVQTMYKKAIPQVHLFQFLTKKIQYLTLDNSVGLSKLSPVATQAFMDSLYWFFPTPLRQYG